MKDEVFDISISYNEKEITLTVKADLPVGPEPFGSDYEVFHDRKHIYTLNQCRNEDDVHCWEIRKTGKSEFDSNFAHAIGAAIDHHYQ